METVELVDISPCLCSYERWLFSILTDSTILVISCNKINTQTRSTPPGQPLLCCPVRHGRQRGAWVRVPEPPRSRAEEGKGETSEDLLCHGRSAGHLCTRSTTAPATPGSPALINGLHREEKRKSYAFRKPGLLKHDMKVGSDLAEDRCMSVGHLSEWTSSLRSWWCVWSYAPQQKDPVSPYLNKKSVKIRCFRLDVSVSLGNCIPNLFYFITHVSTESFPSHMV